MIWFGLADAVLLGALELLLYMCTFSLSAHSSSTVSKELLCLVVAFKSCSEIPSLSLSMSFFFSFINCL